MMDLWRRCGLSSLVSARPLSLKGGTLCDTVFDLDSALTIRIGYLSY